MQSRIGVHKTTGRRGRIRTAIATLAVLALLALPAVALASAFKVTATYPKAQPVAGKGWPITLTVTKGKQKLNGTVKYEFVIPGIYTTTRKGKKVKDGVYKDNLKFPKAAVGITIHLHVLVKTKYGTRNVEHTVTPKQ